MYYEEKVINGILCWRGDPKGSFQTCGVNRLNERIRELEEEIQDMKLEHKVERARDGK